MSTPAFIPLNQGQNLPIDSIALMDTSALADHIQQHEGWVPGSKSQRNLNPGNMKVQGDLGTDEGGFGKFSSYEAGRTALENQVGSFQKRYPNWSPTNLAARWLGSESGNSAQVNPKEGDVKSYGEALGASPAASQAPQESIPNFIPYDASGESEQPDFIPYDASGEAPESTWDKVKDVWHKANTPIADLISGKQDETQNFLTGLSGEKPEEFASKHPILNSGAKFLSGMTSPVGAAALAAAIPTGGLSEAVDGVPVVEPLVDAGITGLKLVNKGASAAFGAEGAGNAITAGEDIADKGANKKNVSDAGLGLLQALAGSYGAYELPPGVPEGVKTAVKIAAPHVVHAAVGAAAGGLFGHGSLTSELAGALVGGMMPGGGDTSAILKALFSNPEEEEAVSKAVAGEASAAQAATPQYSNNPMTRLSQILNEHGGVKPPTPGEPIYQVKGTVGAKTATEFPSTDIPGQKIAVPSRDETLAEALKNRVPGSNPLEKNVPIGQQPPSPLRTPAQAAEETVHPLIRQATHFNGADITERAQEQPEMLNDLMNLEGGQLMDVLRKSGADMSNITSVGKSFGQAERGGTIVDPGNISRQEAFEMLLNDQHYTPEQILKESPPPTKETSYGGKNPRDWRLAHPARQIFFGQK